MCRDQRPNLLYLSQSMSAGRIRERETEKRHYKIKKWIQKSFFESSVLSNFISFEKIYLLVFLVCFYRVNCQALATGLLLVVALPLHSVIQPAGGRIAHPFTCTAAFSEYKLVTCARTLKVAVRCLRTLCIIWVYFHWKSIFIMPHIAEHCLGSVIQHASHRLFSFTGVVSLDFFPDNSGLCSLVLATWAGSLNLTKACAIFSGAMIP